MLTLKNLTVTIKNKTILSKLNYTFEKGKTYAVMGPNGSGKSTLALSLMGHPGYTIEKGSQIIFEGKNITKNAVDERSKKGIFLSFQSPLSLSGVKVYQLLQLALHGVKDPLKIRDEARHFARELGMNEELLGRPLNDGASGGERKKMEVLQAAVLDKKLLIFDEVDTGVDVDSLKSISKFLINHKNDRTYIMITHYNRILHYLKPDVVLIIKNGEIVRVGDAGLAVYIEEHGYESILKDNKK